MCSSSNRISSNSRGGYTVVVAVVLGDNSSVGVNSSSERRSSINIKRREKCEDTLSETLGQRAKRRKDTPA